MIFIPVNIHSRVGLGSEIVCIDHPILPNPGEFFKLRNVTIKNSMAYPGDKEFLAVMLSHHSIPSIQVLR